jgi:hypothetical protein
MSQTPPEPEDLRYAIERFTVDAQRWQDNATTLGNASASAASITVDPLAFGPATWLDMAYVYEQVHQMLTRRLREGSEQFDKIADNLVQASHSDQGTPRGVKMGSAARWRRYRPWSLSP